MNCVFCKIIARELPAQVVFENDEVIVIKDRAPKAPVHVLIIPKEHVQDAFEITPEKLNLWQYIGSAVQEIARIVPAAQQCKLIMNNGAQAGQRVFHAHVHLLAGYAGDTIHEI